MLPPFLSAHLFELRVLLLQLSCAKGIWPACALCNEIMISTMIIIAMIYNYNNSNISENKCFPAGDELARYMQDKSCLSRAACLEQTCKAY